MGQFVTDIKIINEKIYVKITIYRLLIDMPICPNCNYEFKEHKSNITPSEIKEVENTLKRIKKNILMLRYNPLLILLFICEAILTEYLLAQRWIIPIDLHIGLITCGAALVSSVWIAYGSLRLNRETKKLEIKLRDMGFLSESESLRDLIRKLK